MAEIEHLTAWLDHYGDDPRVILWLQNNKPPHDWILANSSLPNAAWAYYTMPGAIEWAV